MELKFIDNEPTMIYSKGEKEQIQLNMIQDLMIAVFNMINLVNKKDIEDQYDEASFVLHEMLLLKLGKQTDSEWSE